MCLGPQAIKLFILSFVLIFMSRAWSQAGVIPGNFYQTNINATNWWRSGSSLDLDFANDRYRLNGTNYTGISNFITASSATFTRSSTATYIDSNGLVATAAADVPRLTYNSHSRTPKGILIEDSSTNLITQSQNFNTGNWQKGSGTTVTSNAIMAPDGTMTGSFYNGTVTGAFNNTGVGSIPASSTVTRSIYIKAGTYTNLRFEFTDSTNCSNYCVALFNLNTGVASWTSVRTGQGAVHMERLQNGWFRVSATFTYSATGNSNFVIYLGCYGTCSGTAYIWGAQYEVRPFVSSYIPTTGASATRTADNFSLPAGTWFTGSQGTFLAQSYGNLNAAQIGYGRIIGGIGSKAYLGFNGSGGNQLSTFNGTVPSMLLLSMPYVYPTTTYLTPIRAAIAWDDTTMTRTMASSGLSASGAYSGSYSAADIYPGGSDYNRLNAPLTRMTFYKTRMSDAFLKGMSP